MATWRDVDWRSVFRERFPKLTPSSRLKKVCKVEIPKEFFLSPASDFFSWDRSFFFDVRSNTQPGHWYRLELDIETGSVTVLGTGVLRSIVCYSGVPYVMRDGPNFDLLTGKEETPPGVSFIEHQGVKYSEVIELVLTKPSFGKWRSKQGDYLTTSGDRIDSWPCQSQIPDAYTGITPLWIRFPNYYSFSIIAVGFNLMKIVDAQKVLVESGSREFELPTQDWFVKSVTVWKGKVYFLATRGEELFLLEVVN